MGILNREQILNADDLQVVQVNVPEWGGEVSVKPMTAAQRGDFEGWAAEQRKELDEAEVNIKFITELVVRSIVDEAGERIFNEDDGEALADKSLKALMRINTEVLKINGLDDDADKEIEKNLKPGQSDDSVSD